MDILKKIMGIKEEINDIEKYIIEQENSIVKKEESEYEKFDFKLHMKDFVDTKLAINCRNKDGALILTTAFGILNLIWGYDDIKVENKNARYDYGDKTCYSFEGGKLYCDSIDYYKNSWGIVAFD